MQSPFGAHVGAFFELAKSNRRSFYPLFYQAYFTSDTVIIHLLHTMSTTVIHNPTFCLYYALFPSVFCFGDVQLWIPARLYSRRALHLHLYGRSSQTTLMYIFSFFPWLSVNKIPLCRGMLGSHSITPRWTLFLPNTHEHLSICTLHYT